MQRGYSVQDFVNMVTHFRQKIPRLTLSTDVIVGFPTETEVDFLDTMKLMREVKPDIVNLSRFGARDGTKAASMDGQVHSDVSKWRSAEMTMLVRQISKEKNESWVGWEGPILLDEFAENSLVGRNFAYKSCVIPIRSYTGVNAQNRQASSLGEEIGFKAVRATTSALQGVAMH
jgi:tRNA A37 methylthiotransferase MiaB